MFHFVLSTWIYSILFDPIIENYQIWSLSSILNFFPVDLFDVDKATANLIEL